MAFLNFSAMFQGLAQGTEALGKTEASKEEQQSRQEAEDRRQQASQAFQDNLRRFELKSNADLQNQLEDKRIGEQQARDVITDKHWTAESSDRAAALASQERHQTAMEGVAAQNAASLEAERKSNADFRKSQEDRLTAQIAAAEAAAKRGDATTAAKIADDMTIVPRYNYTKAEAEVAALQKAGKEPNDPELMDAKITQQRSLNELNKVEKRAQGFRDEAAKKIGYGDDAAKPADTAAPKPAGTTPLVQPDGAASPTATPTAAPAAAAPGATPLSAPAAALPTPGAPLPGLGNNAPPADPLASLSPEQAAAVKGLVAKGQATQADALAWVKSDKATPDAIKRASGLATPATATTAGVPAAPATTQPTSFLQPTGQAGAAPPADAAATPPSAAVAPPPTAPAAAAAPAGPDPAQLDAMSAKLNQTEEGKAVLTTLERLGEASETGSSTVAKKMRRAAEIQLQQIFPGQNVDALINHILQQNS
jgi:hypothetical protein